MLTPAFHFKILEDFVHVFNEQSSILVDKLNQQIEKKNEFDVFSFITLATLDVICGQFSHLTNFPLFVKRIYLNYKNPNFAETAMGRNVNAQNESESDYVKAVYE